MANSVPRDITQSITCILTGEKIPFASRCRAMMECTCAGSRHAWSRPPNQTKSGALHMHHATLPDRDFVCCTGARPTRSQRRNYICIQRSCSCATLSVGLAQSERALMQYVALFCSVLQCVAVCSNELSNARSASRSPHISAVVILVYAASAPSLPRHFDRNHN